MIWSTIFTFWIGFRSVDARLSGSGSKNSPQQQQRERETSSTFAASIATQGYGLYTTTEGDRPSDYLGIVPKAYEPWPTGQLPLPCFPAEEGWSNLAVQNSPANEGFMYMKLYKTGSSTTSGIDLRIARNLANRTESVDTPICKTRFDHGQWNNPAARFAAREKAKSFLWTVVRDPTKRLTSFFFHMQVSRLKIEPTDDNFKNWLFTSNSQVKENYYFEALYPGVYIPGLDDPVAIGNKIVQEYDFIGVTERMDEVAVLLMMLLDLPMADVLFLSAKHGGSYDAGGYEGKCTYIWPTFVSKGMEEYFDSEEWQEAIKYDKALYRAAHHSMNLTIERLGRAQFESNLVRFRQAHKLAQDRCLKTTVFPCTESGELREDTDCIWKDSGCGSTCLDEVATELNLW